MSRQQIQKLGIAVMLTMLFLVACRNSASTPLLEAPPATSTPVPEAPQATSTPELSLARDLLGTGDAAPDFTLADSNGNMVHLTDELLDNQLVILVFYHHYT